LSIDGNFTVAAATTLSGGNDVTVSGGLLGSSSLTGRTITFDGTGIWSVSGTTSSNIIINTAGTITIQGTISFGGSGTLTYTTGTVTTTSSTLTLSGTPTLNTDGITFNNITTSGTITLTSNLTAGGTLTVNLATTFSGSYNIDCSALNMISAITLTLSAGRTLTFDSLSISNLNGTNTIVSGTPSSHTHLNFTGTPSNSYCYGVVFTDVDASSGNKIYNYKGGTLTRTSNIVNFDNPITAAATFAG
jgi:hypothetical protein